MRLTLFAVIAACASSALAAQPPEHVFAGTVLYAPTGQPIVNARVELKRPSLALFGPQPPAVLLASGKTDRHGRFRLITRAKGPYDLTCFRPGPHAAWALTNVKPSPSMRILYQPDPLPHP